MRSALGLAIVACGSLLAACAMDPNAGMTQMRPDAMPYGQARAMCFERSFGTPGGGQGSDMAKTLAYYACMQQQGWADTRTVF